jgi:hypothetical protein
MARAKQAEMLLQFNLPNEQSSVSFIDLAQCYSLVNRVFCRQGMQIAIAGMSVYGSIGSKVAVARLPEHWPCINAWEKGYHVWRESQKQVLEHEPSIQGRYADFKVYMDEFHSDAGTGQNLIPAGYVTTSGDPHSYDWNPSEIQIPNDPTHGTTTGYYMHLVGATTSNSKGLISGYAASRARPQTVDPNVPYAGSEDWMREAFDVGDDLDEIRLDILYNNNEPPYMVGEPGGIPTFYPGGTQQGGLVTEAVLFSRGGLGTQTFAGGFTAPCGLLRVVVNSDEGSSNCTLIVRLMPGDYKGLMARPMVDVN